MTLLNLLVFLAGEDGGNPNGTSGITWDQIWLKLSEDFGYWLTTGTAMMIYILIFGISIFLVALITIINNFARPRYQKVALTSGMVKGEDKIPLEDEGLGAPLPAPSGSPEASSEQKEEKPAEEPTDGSFHRFKALSAFDEEHPRFEKVKTPPLTLKELAASLRTYASGVCHLYYSDKDVRTFLASLCCSKVILLQGMSGTGKTSLPVAFGKWVKAMTSVVPVQPTWKERSDMLGYYNEFTGTFSETPLLRSLYEAGGDNRLRLIVLDEANIARIEYYFAEFLSLLELPDEKARIIQVAPSALPGDPMRLDGGQMTLPANVWFILTANNDDSTFAISDKVYDRAMVLDLDKRAEAFDAPAVPSVPLTAEYLTRLAKRAERRYALTKRDERRISQLDEFLRNEMHIGFGNRITRQIKQFVPCFIAAGGDELEGLDHVLARKVMRKLGSASPVYLRAKEGALLQLMATLWGEGTMKECEDTIRRLAESK